MRLEFILGVGLLCLACVGVVAANEPPLASAGLDQESRVNATVYLDAGGSIDPDGSIGQYEWTIETPDGNTTTPDCPTCGQTWFVPRQTGRYNVTVEVTDENGVSRNDTLYVDVGRVATVGQPPSTPAGSGGGVPPSLGGTSGGGGGSLSGSGRWSAVVDEGDELVLSNPRGADFAFDTPTGQVTIDESDMAEAMTDDGEVTYSEVDHAFLEQGVTREDLEDATDRSTERGNTCKSTSGRCTNELTEQGSLSKIAAGDESLQPGGGGAQPSDPANTGTSNDDGLDGAPRLTDAIDSFLGSNKDKNNLDHSEPDDDSDWVGGAVDTVFNDRSSGDDDDDSSWDSNDDDSGDDDRPGEDVPMEL